MDALPPLFPQGLEIEIVTRNESGLKSYPISFRPFRAHQARGMHHDDPSRHTKPPPNLFLATCGVRKIWGPGPACPHTGQALALDPATHDPGHPTAQANCDQGWATAVSIASVRARLRYTLLPNRPSPLRIPFDRGPEPGPQWQGAGAESHREGTRARTRARSVCRYCAHDAGESFSMV